MWKADLPDLRSGRPFKDLSNSRQIVTLLALLDSSLPPQVTGFSSLLPAPLLVGAQILRLTILDLRLLANFLDLFIARGGFSWTLVRRRLPNVCLFHISGCFWFVFQSNRLIRI